MREIDPFDPVLTTNPELVIPHQPYTPDAEA
jgi:hypothetical protein